jgi:hypothetical protein
LIDNKKTPVNAIFLSKNSKKNFQKLINVKIEKNKLARPILADPNK